MPFYDYECVKCGVRFEELQKISDQPLRKHNGCGGRVRRLPSAPAIQFKGTGFYITDYARAGKSSGDGNGKKESGAEAKPAASEKSDKPAKKDTTSKTTKEAKS